MSCVKSMVSFGVPRLFFGLNILTTILASDAFNLAGSNWLPFSSSQAHRPGFRGFTSSDIGDGPYPSPSCKSIECPIYKLIHNESEFEIRQYNFSLFAETESIQDVSFTKASYRGFHSLFQYIEGENEESAHVPMTAPVVTSIIPSAGPFCSSAFTVKFYVPSKFQESPPTPKPSLHPSVHISPTPTVCIAVRKFGGFANDFNVASEASALATTLSLSPWKDVVNKNFTSESYSVAQYNSPFEIFSRQNEIWVKFEVPKGGEECVPSGAIAMD